MRNIRITYLYRDAANYKQRNSRVFLNPSNLKPEEVETRLLSYFLPEGTFIADQLGLAELFFETNDQDDHCLHELEAVEYSDQVDVDGEQLDISDLIRKAEQAAHEGWRGFTRGSSETRAHFKLT